MDKKIAFDDFFASVPVENQDFVKELHNRLSQRKAGTWFLTFIIKKTVANYVFRRKGVLVRIYGVHVGEYENVLETLPDEMIRGIQKAPICKRLADPAACDPKCSMGYDFWLKGEHYQKCRNSAFLFLVSPQNHPFIQSLLLKEVGEWEKSNLHERRRDAAVKNCVFWLLFCLQRILGRVKSLSFIRGIGKSMNCVKLNEETSLTKLI